MAQELIYTSVPKGLDPRRTGFCTVAMTRGMSPYMVKQLEGLTAYTPVFMHYDVNSSYNPPSIFHYPISDGRNRCELLARVSDCGLDYTKRSNKIGHFILISSEERAKLSEGPSCLFSDRLFMTEWKGEPQYFPAERILNSTTIAFKKAIAWEKATGDAGWASWLAEWYLAEPDKPCFVIFDPLRHLNLQALVSESLMLLPQNRRWEVTWNTYLSALPAGLSCNWRFCIGNPDILRSIGCNDQANVLDLRQGMGMAGNSALSQCARTGTNPYSNVKQSAATMTASVGFAQAERKDGDTSLNAMIRKHQQEEEEKAVKKAKEAVTPLRSSDRTPYRLKRDANQQQVSSDVNSSYRMNDSSYLPGHAMMQNRTNIPMSSIEKNDAKWKKLLFVIPGIIVLFVVIFLLLRFIMTPKSKEQPVENSQNVISAQKSIDENREENRKENQEATANKSEGAQESSTIERQGGDPPDGIQSAEELVKNSMSLVPTQEKIEPQISEQKEKVQSHSYVPEDPNGDNENNEEDNHKKEAALQEGSQKDEKEIPSFGNVMPYPNGNKGNQQESIHGKEKVASQNEQEGKQNHVTPSLSVVSPVQNGDNGNTEEKGQDNNNASQGIDRNNRNRGLTYPRTVYFPYFNNRNNHNSPSLQTNRSLRGKDGMRIELAPGDGIPKTDKPLGEKGKKNKKRNKQDKR